MTHRRRSRVTPTHHELLAIKEELEIARKGEHVLERRRDGLVFLLLDLLDRWKDLRRRAESEFQTATALHVRGEIREGEISLRELAESRNTHPEVIFSETKVLGLRVPSIVSSRISTRLEERGYGLLGTSALDDDIVTSYETVLEYVVRLAELRAVIFRLLAEIRRLRIRVNYLTHRLIPELEAEQLYVQRYLDQREQEERYRQFRVKKRREERTTGNARDAHDAS